jgi:hypothetical protein
LSRVRKARRHGWAVTKQCRTVYSGRPNLLSHDTKSAWKWKKLPQSGRGALRPTVRKRNERKYDIQNASNRFVRWGQDLAQGGHCEEAGLR